MASTAPQLSTGTRVGEYEITAIIGEGGFGTVYAGVHPAIGKKVAIKVLRDGVGNTPDMVKRFQQEARAVNEIGHPGIIDIFGFGELPSGAPYLIMELLEGTTLAERIATHGKLPAAELVETLHGIADAVDAAHGAGIIHRDLKPENVFLVETGSRRGVKVLDFGIAKLAEGALVATSEGVPMGSPLYMSPEQCFGQPATTASDVYSFGVLAFEGLTAQRPIAATSFPEIVTKQLSDQRRSVSECGGPATLDAVLSKCLARAPEARFGSLGEASAAIAQALTGAPRPALADTLPTVVDGVPPVPKLSANAPTARWKLAVGALGVLAVAAAGVWQSQSGDQESNASTSSDNTAVATAAMGAERRVHPIQFTASSHLLGDWSRFDQNYHPNYVGDGDPHSAWTEGADGTGTGEWLRMSVHPMEGVSELRLRIRNGYAKTRDLYNKNARLATITLKTLPAGDAVKVTVRDVFDWQELKVPLSGGSVHTIELHVDGVVEGTHYDDLCVSDIEIFATATSAPRRQDEQRAFEKLIKWKASRLRAAHMFQDIQGRNQPIAEEYTITSAPRPDLDCGNEASCTLALLDAAKTEPAFASRQGAIERARRAVLSGFGEYVPVEIRSTNTRALPKASGTVSAVLGRGVMGGLPMPIAGTLGHLQVRTLRRIFDGQPEVDIAGMQSGAQDAACRESRLVIRTLTPNEPGPPMRELLIAACGKGSPRGTWQLLVYRESGELDLLVGPNYTAMVRWKSGEHGTFLSAGAVRTPSSMLSAAATGSAATPSPIPAASKQLVAVVTDGWDQSRGTLRRFDRRGAQWVSVGRPKPVQLGRMGLGWGIGLHGSGPAVGRSGPTKAEGDQRAPAGVFTLGRAYGYATATSSKVPYTHSSPGLRCVDDPASTHYNRIVETEQVAADWNSAEVMRRDDELYRWVIEVDHNTLSSDGDPRRGAGSCIFLHVWGAPTAPTVGCTALARPHIEELLGWLDPTRNPVLVQLPLTEYEALADVWALPKTP